ncbi:MAG: hypothetical protein JWP97_3711 [Labilithrix sp.]|nr:hypothetical protein [Labilithrix sp.]
MKRRLVLGLALVTSLASVAACSDDGSGSSSSSSSSGGSSSGSSGTSGSSGSSGGGAACLDPTTFDYVVPLHKEGDSNFLTYQATADESHVFISTLSAVYALDPGTRALNVLYAPPNAVVPHHYLRKDDVVVNSGSKLWAVPKTGGAPVPLPDFTKLPNGSLAGTQEVVIDGDTLYALEVGDSGTVYKHDLTTGAETDLGAEPRSKTSSIRMGADAIYSYYANDESDNAPTTLWKVAKTGGAITPIPITGAPSPVNYPLGVNGNDLFVLSVDAEHFVAHVLRVPTGGGAAVDLGTTTYVLTFKGQSFVVPAQGGTVLRLLNDLFWIPEGAAAMTSLGCFPDDYAPLGVAANGKKAFVGIGNDQGGGMIALPLP